VEDYRNGVASIRKGAAGYLERFPWMETRLDVVADQRNGDERTGGIAEE